MKHTQKNWSGNINFHDSETFFPDSISQLQQLVASSSKIRARGSAHCFNSIADTNSVAVILNKMPQNIEVDSAKKIARVPAGMKNGDLATFLQNQGWALHNMASLPHISVAGAIATATHGSGRKNGALHTAVKALEVVGPDGSLHQIDDAHDVFYAAVTSLGLYGIVNTLDLTIEPTFNVTQVVYPGLSREIYSSNLDEVMSSAYSVSFFTTWQSNGVGDVWAKYRGGSNIKAEIFGAKPATIKHHPVPGMNPDSCTDQLGTSAPWNERLSHFKMEFTPSAGDELQTEFFIDFIHAEKAFQLIEEIADNFSQYLFVSEIRAIAADQHWLSGAYNHDVIAFHFTWKPVDGVKAAISLIEKELTPLLFRPHLGKVFSASPSHIQKALPKFQDFVKAVVDFDPESKFSNAFTNALLVKSI